MKELGTREFCAKGALWIAFATSGFAQDGTPLRPEIPRFWNEAEISAMELPRVRLNKPPVHVSAEYYYQIPPRTIYKTYPIYHPNREPKDYLEWLKTQEPQITFDTTKLHTKQDWIQAGEIVFS